MMMQAPSVDLIGLTFPFDSPYVVFCHAFHASCHCRRKREQSVHAHFAPIPGPFVLLLNSIESPSQIVMALTKWRPLGWRKQPTRHLSHFFYLPYFASNEITSQILSNSAPKGGRLIGTTDPWLVMQSHWPQFRTTVKWARVCNWLPCGTPKRQSRNCWGLPCVAPMP